MYHSVLLIEDDDAVAAMIVRAFARVGWPVVRAGTAREGLERLTRERADLVLLDVGLPDADGLDVCRTIRATPAIGDLPVIMVTAHGLEAERVEGFDCGADDYVVKPFGVAELLARAQAVVRRAGARHQPAASAIAWGTLAVDRVQRRVTVAGREVALRTKELDLLLRLLAEPGRVFHRQELLADVWGVEHPGDIVTRTVDVHIRRLRSKLAEAGTCIETVKGVGYRFNADTRV